MEKAKRIFGDGGELAHFAAHQMVMWGVRCAEAEGSFSVALCGGRSPGRLCETLIQEPYRSRMPWGRTHFFWTDERLVPPDHPWSNFRLVDEILLSRVPKLEEHVHRIKGELGSATAAAMEYERELRCFFFWKGDKEKPKVRARTFDLVILGLGADGHIASLFPGDSALHISGRLAVAVGQGLGDPPVERVTLTIEAINAATRVWILVRGRGKVELARKILYEPQRDGPDYPAARIRPQGELLWLIGP